MKFTTILAMLTTSATVAYGAALDVWVPPITSPTESTVWTVGTQVNVTWDTSTKPAQVTNPIGDVILVIDGLLQLADPLAEGFPLTDGWVTVTVPDVTPGPYNIVLFGDSGNESPTFQIVA